MNRSIIFVLLMLTLPWTFGEPGGSDAQQLRVGYVVTAGQRYAFEKVFERYRQETGVQVIGMPRTDPGFRHDLPLWLLQGQETPDVVFWQASQRLYFFAAQNALHPLTSVWKSDNLDHSFSHVKAGVTFNGEVYGLPMHYYSWGLYYNKALIEAHGGTPANWEEFIALCLRLKNDGVTPIGLGSRDVWPVAAWFDYIDLRLNGLDFHLKLLSGKISFSDARVRRVLTEWKRLIDLQLFNSNFQRIDWDEIFPYMYREKVGFTLSGNFVATKVPAAIANSIGFMPFPKMANVEQYEEAPMNVLVIPRRAKNVTEAEQFVRYMARADVQSALAAELGYLPANKSGTVGQGAFTKASADMLRRSAGVSQFFDRDTIPAFEKKALPILNDFVRDGDIKKTVDSLEQARLDVFRD